MLQIFTSLTQKLQQYHSVNGITRQRTRQY